MTDTLKPFAFDEDKLRAQLDKVCASQNKYVGLKNHNPYIWIEQKVKPLRSRLDGKNKDGTKGTKDTSKELHDAIMALPLDHVPLINPNIVTSATETKDVTASEGAQESPKLAPTGLNLKVK